MGKNIEIKANCADLIAFENKVKEMPVHFEGTDQQTDTFYVVPKGRLKLRESSLYGNILIPYFRPDTNDSKESDYSLLKVDDVQQTKLILQKMFGVRLVVEKERKIYIYENIRIHIDRVKKLGNFIEFEAVLSDGEQEKDNHLKLEILMKQLDISKNQLIANAYADLLIENNPSET